MTMSADSSPFVDAAFRRKLSPTQSLARSESHLVGKCGSGCFLSVNPLTIFTSLITDATLHRPVVFLGFLSRYGRAFERTNERRAVTNDLFHGA